MLAEWLKKALTLQVLSLLLTHVKCKGLVNRWLMLVIRYGLCSALQTA